MNQLIPTVIFISFFLFTCSSQKNENNPKNEGTKTEIKVDSSILVAVKKHVDVLCNTSKPRNHENIEILDSIANYIKDEFAVYADTVYFQEYKVNGKVYRNVVAALNMNASERIVIGAHYDVCETTPGADDNASGVAGMIEIGKLLSEKKLTERIDLVAFTLEEPPYFRSSQMGSYQYAAYLKKNKINVKYMACLEMIGYFTEEENSQEYPVAAMSQQYGTVGNFLAIVENENQGDVGFDFFTKLKKKPSMKYEYVKAPSFMTGVDFSDHLSFWKKKIRAFMITDTSFYRNKSYHQKSDTPSQLNFDKIVLFVMDFANTF
jgi:Zn-dependent M28 family amino/carboxypeptidase